MLVLKALALEPMHVYGVVVRIEEISRGVFPVNAGSRFVAFHAFAQGWTDQER